MIELSAPYRRATPDDAPALAELVNMAGEGMPLYLWTKLAEEGGTSPWVIGRRRAQRDTGSFSYRNAVVRDDDGEVTAALIGYVLPASPEPINYAELPAMFVPLQELENLAPGTWYVNVVATYPEHRGKGYGGDLLAIAEQFSEDACCAGMSLIVADANIGARRLYERLGYVEKATRPMVKEQWESRAEQWVLLVK